MEKYKIDYNNLLKRYSNGLEYLSVHKEETEKWLPELEKIVDELGKMIEKYNIPNDNILTGFKEE